ncbi:MAG: thioredoxin domain-containing protein [Anaerolineaceae bacterium]|nr:thioredoxin domain-containing protein [Anaerolineaceae bacterium]
MDSILPLDQRLQKIWKNNKSIIIVVSIIIILGIIAILFPKEQYSPVPEERLVLDPFLGAENAPITIIEYGDYACSGCKLWHNAGVLDEILALYEGKVKFIWRDNAHISSASRAAANAAQCAFDQDKFWEYHDLLFENSIGFSVEGLKSYALMLDLDADRFNACVDQGLYMNKVVHSMNLAGEYGLSITPAFLVNGEVIIGPPPSSYLSEMITRLLVEN